jgi:hypothetical protein
MSGSALLHTISFMALVLVILLTVWIVLVLESGGHPSRTTQEAAKPGDEPGEATAPEREGERPAGPKRGTATPARYAPRMAGYRRSASR